MNNGKKLDTQKYNYRSRSGRGKRGPNKMVFIILLSLLILALIAAIAFVVVDLVDMGGEKTEERNNAATGRRQRGYCFII